MVHADDGCTEQVLEDFDSFIKPRGQEFLEELDVWFSSRKGKDKTSLPTYETGLYMVHYVDDIEDKKTLRQLLRERGAELEDNVV